MHVPMTNAATSGQAPLKGADGKYHIRILLAQWEIRAFDEVRMVQDHGVSLDPTVFGQNLEKQWLPYAVTGRMGSFDKNSTIDFTVFSKDVQHGFSINELGLAIASIRPTGQQTVGDPVSSGDLVWPNKDVTISAFCHIFCGLGHPDMKFKFVIGKGSFEAGPWIYWGVLGLNIALFAYVAYNIRKKITV